MKKIFYLSIFVFAWAGCATHPEIREPEELPEEAVQFQFGYSAAFDRIIKALKAEGYVVTIADPRAGFIQTEPKVLSTAGGEAGGIQYLGMYRIHVDGDRNHSWALIDLVVLPELPSEREKLIQRLQGEPPSTP